MQVQEGLGLLGVGDGVTAFNAKELGQTQFAHKSRQPTPQENAGTSRMNLIIEFIEYV
jgi:hypothetical protein